MPNEVCGLGRCVSARRCRGKARAARPRAGADASGRDGEGGGVPRAGGAADQRARAARICGARLLPRAARRARPPAAPSARHHSRLVPGCAPCGTGDLRVRVRVWIGVRYARPGPLLLTTAACPGWGPRRSGRAYVDWCHPCSAPCPLGGWGQNMGRVRTAGAAQGRMRSCYRWGTLQPGA